ncbi:condensation domain protein [Enhygromyxa salina]|uniref:Phthiocerol/phthiodiolone dimycocerosyl transferase n=1 Tax=Enhygromyxa salina TaxID=215803 RepID=A0A0C2D5I8_9BACT|nr:condensation domain-containing protein [Enhygromyxa salina]KIG15302.1 condensation domain protein [Enhygromyxa salina]
MNRYLTTSERVFLAMAEQVVMNPVVMVRCRGVLPVERVEHAIRTVAARHPALGVRVVRDAQPWFSDRDVPPVPLRIVDRESSQHWREIVRQELNEPMPIEAGPLIRFVLVRDEHACELICTTDHVNADGRSGLFVLRDVLRVIDDPQLRLVPLRERTCFDDYLESGGVWDLAWGPRMPDALRGLLADHTRGLLGALERRGVGRGAGLNRLRALALGRPEDPPAVAGPAPIEFVQRRLDVARTTALSDACRAHDNTVLCALVVACADALATVDGPDARGLIGCVTPIDIRSLLRPSVGDDFGIYAWAPTSVHPVGPRADFWGLAARTRRLVKAYRSVPALAGMRRLLDLMELTEGTPLASAYDRASRALLDGMMVVSNLGRVSLPEQAAGVEVESFGFYAMIPNVEFVLGVQSFRGVLEMNYCCSPNWLRPAMIEGVADRVEATLAAASGAATRAGGQRFRFSPGRQSSSG